MWNDFKFAVRQLRKNIGFSAVAIATLALGLGATIAIFTVVDAVLLRRLPYPESDRLVWLLEQFPSGIGSIAYPNFLDWKTRQTTCEKLAAWNQTGMPLTGAGDPME